MYLAAFGSFLMYPGKRLIAFPEPNCPVSTTSGDVGTTSGITGSNAGNAYVRPEVVPEVQ